MTPRQANGFTLVELMVVIAIIVALMAILTPALEQAIYRAELAVCGANQKFIGTQSMLYAMDHRRYYPDTGRGNLAQEPSWIGIDDGSDPQDRRRVLKAALGDINKALNDPVTGGQLDFERSSVKRIFSNYHLFFGWQYALFASDIDRVTSNAAQRYSQLRKMGDHFEWIEWSDAGKTAGPVRKSTVLASDRDWVTFGVEGQHSHRDSAGVLYPIRRQDDTNPWQDPAVAQAVGPTVTLALWWSGPVAVSPPRGLTDNNYLMGDGSVMMFNNVQWRWQRETRLRRAPLYMDARQYFPDAFQYLPRSE